MPDISATRPATGAPIDTPWGQQVHDMLEGIQTGTVMVPVSASVSGTITVTFPRAYTAPPIGIVSSGLNTYNASATTNTTAIVIVLREVRETSATTSVLVHWMAIGTPA